MENVGLKSAYKIRVDVLNVGMIGMVPKSKSESHDIELIHQEKNPEGKIRNSWPRAQEFS